MLRWKKARDPLRPMATRFHSNRPYWVIKAVMIIPNTLGFNVPILLIIFWMLEIGHPRCRIQSSKIKSDLPLLRRSFGWRFRNWIDMAPFSGLITPSFKSTSTCFLISLCFSSECLRGGCRLHGSRHLFSLITIFMGSPAPDAPCQRKHRWILEIRLGASSEAEVTL